ncbi:hypothetical protein ACHAXA_010278 [Cyclostephanos tholiformis]|uniref:RCC1-like domain-containing protein n=1 Tax=Cyclostephanos tholiformis TaxID=382380 RepID=A0ABD3RDC9_9STRA
MISNWTASSIVERVRRIRYAALAGHDIRREIVVVRRRDLSTSSSAAESLPSSSLDDPHPNPHPPPYGAIRHYMWGTSKKGTIPSKFLEEATPLLPSAASSAFASPASSPPTSSSGDEIVVDHPMRLNFGGVGASLRSFLLGEGGGSDDDDGGVFLERTYCGASGTAMVLGDGRCFVMGSNKNGELGIGRAIKETSRPIRLSIPHPVVKASLGPNFSAALTAPGDLYTFGYGGSRINGLGCLGHGHDVDTQYVPRLVESLVEDGCIVSDVHCGEYSMTILTSEGEVLTCGAGSYGRLGNLETIDQLYPEPVELLGSEDVARIACGHAFSLALSADGIVYAWGRNNEGQLGTGMGLAADMYAMESLPRPVEGALEGREVVRIAAGHSHAAAVTSDGALYTWGMNYTHEPKLETTLLHARVVDVACGQNYTLALDEDGRVYSMGKGKTGVLGLASVRASAYPILVEGIPEEERVVSISCGWAHVACATILK